MKISFIQAILIGVVYYLGVTGTPWLSLLGSISFMQKPLVAGTVVGIILGDPVQGVIIGAAIQLPYIAFISAGGTAPVDPGLAGTLGTALAIASGADPQTAVTLAMPIGLLGTVIWVAHMTIDVFFVHMADRINFLHVVPPQIILFLISVIPVTLAAYYGAGAVTTILGYLDGTPLHVLQVIGGLLPALGIAMNLRSINRPNTMLFFILGFVMSIYMGLDVIVIAVLGAIIAYLYTITPRNEIGGFS